MRYPTVFRLNRFLSSRPRHSAALSLVASIAALSSVVIVPPTPASAQIIYSNDFETNTDGFTNNGRVVLPTDNAGFGSANNSQWLGTYGGNGAVAFNTISNLIVGQTYAIDFDLFIGASWDGNEPSQPAGPDGWRLTVNGGATPAVLIDTSFANIVPADNILSVYSQSYSDTHVLGGVSSASNAPFTGADVARTDAQTGIGGNAIYDRYGIYYFGHGAGNPTILFTATSSNLDMIFAGVGLQDASDEFWAIDNVVVRAISPEPSAAALLCLGLAGVYVRRRLSSRC